MTNPTNKGPRKPWRFASAGSTFDPAVATPDASFPSTATYAYGSATITPYVYVCDSWNNRIQVFDYDGNWLFSFGSFGSGDGQFNNPYGVTNDGDRVYVTDTGNHRVQIFDLDGNYVSQFGTHGSAVGQFDMPRGIAVDNRYLYVIDQANNRFQIFTKEGAVLFSLGSFGSGVDEFSSPTDIYVDDYYIYIDDTGNSRIVIYEKAFQFNYAFITLPALTLTASGYSYSGFASITLPSPGLSLTASGSAGGVGGGSPSLPALTLTASGTVTAVAGSASITLPALRMASTGGSGVAGSVGSASIELPALVLTATGHVVGVGTATITLPALTLSAYGLAGGTATYKGVVVNLKTKAITELTGYAFNSLVVFGGNLYGVSSTGIYPLTGDKDITTDIDATVETGTENLHKRIVNRLVDFWLKWRTAGDAVLTVREDEDDSDTTEYEIEGDPTSKLYGERVKFGKGHKGQFVDFTFANRDGADFDLAELSIKAEPNPARER